MEATMELGLTALRAESERTYQKYVFDVARGVEIDMERLRELLWPLGRMVEDFERHAAAAKQRIAAAAELERGEELSPGVALAKTNRDAVWAKIEAIETEFNQKMSIAQTELQDATAKHDTIMTEQRSLKEAEKLLQQTSDPAIGEEIAGLESRRSELGGTVYRGREAARRAGIDRKRISELNERAERNLGFPEPPPADLRREAEGLEARIVAELDAVIRKGDEAAVEIAVIDGQLAALRERQLDAEIGMSWS